MTGSNVAAIWNVAALDAERCVVGRRRAITD